MKNSNKDGEELGEFKEDVTQEENGLGAKTEVAGLQRQDFCLQIKMRMNQRS